MILRRLLFYILDANKETHDVVVDLENTKQWHNMVKKCYKMKLSQNWL